MRNIIHITSFLTRLVIVLGLTVVAAPTPAQTPSELFEQGTYSEEATGGPPQNMKEWVTQASKLVASKMRAPVLSTSERNSAGANRYRVTINRRGEVLEYSQVVKAGHYKFDRATESTINYMSLPRLPSNYEQDELSFLLDMYYAADGYKLRSLYRKKNLERKGIVTSTEIALLQPQDQSSTDEHAGTTFSK